MKEKVKYIPLTEEQREQLLRETGLIQRWLVKRPGQGWTVSGSLPADAEAVRTPPLQFSPNGIRYVRTDIVDGKYMRYVRTDIVDGKRIHSFIDLDQ